MSANKKSIATILEWNGATPAEEHLAQKVSKTLQLGTLYFTYNVPLQVWIAFNKEEDPKSGINFKKSQILNYVPRKECTEFLSFDNLFSSVNDVTDKDIKDFMKVSALVLENLARQFKKFSPFNLKRNEIYYPNVEI